MVLKNNQVEVKPKGFLASREYPSFIVLDSGSILYEEEKALFGYSIEILNLIRVAQKANKMCSDFKSDFKINTDIYYVAMNSVLNNLPFTDAEFINYIESERKKEEFLNFSRSMSDLEREFYLPYEIDFILLGINIDLYFKLNGEAKEYLHESYTDLAYDVRFKKIDTMDYIGKAKELLIESKLLVEANVDEFIS